MAPAAVGYAKGKRDSAATAKLPPPLVLATPNGRCWRSGAGWDSPLTEVNGGSPEVLPKM